MPTRSASVSKSMALDVLVAEHDLVAGRRQPRHGRQRQVRKAQRFPMLGRTRSKVQNDSGFFGAIR